jgi:hypothetical protein
MGGHSVSACNTVQQSRVGYLTIGRGECAMEKNAWERPGLTRLVSTAAAEGGFVIQVFEGPYNVIFFS